MEGHFHFYDFKILKTHVAHCVLYNVLSTLCISRVHFISMAVWGPPWSECEVGKFVVLRCEIGTPSKFGVCVIKVVQKDVEILTGRFPVRTLYGKEYLYTLSNIEPRCVRGGKWNWHNTKSTIDEYDNFNVIMYFDRLIDGALPLVVMQTIEHVHSTKRIFY